MQVTLSARLIAMSKSARKRAARILTWGGSVDDLLPSQKRVALRSFAIDRKDPAEPCGDPDCGFERRVVQYAADRAAFGL